MVSIADIRHIALRLPGAYEHPSYGGRPSWRTKPRMFAWVREKPEALVVWVDSIGERDARIAAEPHKFFKTPHYERHPILLVHLDHVDEIEVTELIGESWTIRAPELAQH